MEKAKWARLQDVFHRAMEQPEESRSAFLQAECGNDPALLKKVQSLLLADADKSAVLGTNTLPPDPNSDLQMAGETVGAYRLVRRVGVGGMGSVFLAERSDGTFDREVALKVVKKGMDTEHVLQRFALERQILARLDHPNIASLLDGGVTGDGRPYFVMEYIDGIPITQYCDQNKLNVAARLKLFQVVCDAVHYAHQSLVVHRDLKPSNILVTQSGEVKLLDFGIAKLLDDSQGESVTQTGLQLLTPAYASPEQLLNDSVTTVTDVYALGVILYELLAGRRPFEARKTPQEFRDQILSGDPSRPSTAVTSQPADSDGKADPDTAERISALRSTGVDRLRKRLQGDLDTICLMALRREPEHRYRSAEQMATDIRRHLSGLPVIARPDTLGYRFGKFVKRHRAGVAVTALIVTAFVSMVIFYTSQLARERDLALDEQRKTNEVVRFVTGLFEVSDPSEARGENISARELLDAGALRISTELADRPTVQATMMRVLGEVYYSLGSLDEAEKLIADSLTGFEQLYGDQNLDVATAKLALGIIRQDRGDTDKADQYFRESLATRTDLLGYEHADVMEAISVRAFLEETIGNYDQAETLHAEALALGRRLFTEDSAYVAEAMAKLAGIYRVLDRGAEAEPLLRDALAMQDRMYGGDHPASASTKRQLAGLLRDNRQFDEAKTLYEDIIASRVRMLGPEHIEVAHTWNSFAHLLADMGDVQGAIDGYEKTIDLLSRAHDGPHPSFAAVYNNLAILYRNREEYGRAVEYYQKSIDMQDAVGLAERHPNRSYPITGKASVYLRQERFAEAEALFRDMLALRRENFPEEHRLISELKSELAAALTGLEQYDEAERLLLDAYDRFLTGRGPEDRRTQRAAQRLVTLYKRMGNPQAAAPYRDASGEKN